ncbi:MAG: galactose oxidase early set domain-containing protein [Candidatus Binatia bacterium]
MAAEKGMRARKNNPHVFWAWTLMVAVLALLPAYEVSYTAASDDNLEKREKGDWYTPPLPPLHDRMQAVHTVLLPNGMVLIVNGSSNRNRIEDDKILDGVDVTDYATVNNTAIFDPEAPPGNHGFTRISSPATPDEDGDSTDLFCSGHLHLWNGNVLFVSGTRLYYPPESFRGHKNAVVFDWENMTWQSAGRTSDGHWYPTLVPLFDGRIAVFSGFSYDAPVNSPLVEFYDPHQPAGEAWTAVNIATLPNGPFTSTIGKGPTNLDFIQFYPRIFPLSDGRLFITGDGAGAGNMESQNSYLMSISPNNGDQPPEVSFSSGPRRKGKVRAYGTAVVDPNSTNGDILLIGGQEGSADINHGPGMYTIPSEYVRADLERVRVHNSPDDWSVELTKNFLGDEPEDVRIMHLAVILPTKQILVINGGNYSFHRPVYHPLLLTPDPSAPGGYRKKRMKAANQPRLYHGAALLLPDGRVFTAGGNATRAARNPDDGSVNLLVKRSPEGVFQFAQEGEFVIPAENWQIEIFSPPYLFIPGPRPEITQAPEVVDYGESASLTVKDVTSEASLVMIKLGSVTHGWDNGQRLADLEFSQDLDTGEVTFTAPTNPHTNPPGYYMLFYVNGEGKPSRAAMIRLGGTPPSRVP